jgi:hypothetical protein
MNFFLSKTSIPESLPEGMQMVIEQLKNSLNQEDCLKNAYEIMTKKYRGYRVKTYSQLYKVFESDLEKMWERNGFMHCHSLNYLMRILLVKSGHFENGAIENRWTAIWYISPHQYLNVRLENGNSVNVDIWGAVYGIEFGDYAHGFH